MIVIAIRFIPTILQELDRILLAQKARGYDMTALTAAKTYFRLYSDFNSFTLHDHSTCRAVELTRLMRALMEMAKGELSYKQLQFQQIDYQVGGMVILFAVTMLLLKIRGSVDENLWGCRGQRNTMYALSYRKRYYCY